MLELSRAIFVTTARWADNHFNGLVALVATTILVTLFHAVVLAGLTASAILGVRIGIAF